MASYSAAETTGSREGSSKSMVSDHISQAVQSTSNLLQLMLQSSPSQARLIYLPRNLLAKTSTVRNTERVMDSLPHVISSLDAYMDNGLESVPHLKTVTQLLENLESSQLKPLYRDPLSSQEPKLTERSS